ncbi:PAB-dependent poly-A-specific ribonuclease subunit PAN2 [Athelia psychrophila]|uniref:PAN2-PAN3 deadenylation complex catalytic subunit PAN2 n=1 Tax=Athelia psychrophila TaxID=1759441 RepID=A0A166VAL8_9AGAM|nr:PAB-dependent poly-A-specific ribonuclease subunit PAN2 [Fibularhizoctonia sp. CBS 109695]
MTTYRPAPSLSNIQGHSVTALAFDPVSDALWTGSNTGNVVALYTPRGMRGVAFPVGGSLAVKKIIVGDQYVRAVGLDSPGVGQWGKGGRNQWYCGPIGTPTTFSNTATGSSSLAVATTSPEILEVNGATGQVIRKTPTPSIVNHLQHTHSCLLSGSSDGILRVHDERTGTRREHGESSVIAHHSGIQGLQYSGNFVFTIGWGLRQGRPFPDPLVKVYDVRTMRALQPIPFSEGPAYINLLPRRSSSLIITSNQGLVNIVDVTNPTNGSEFYQLETPSFISSVAVSPTGLYMGFGDVDGGVHLMTAGSEDEPDYVPTFNGFEGQPIDWADTPEALPDITWTEKMSLSTIGLPYYDQSLLSSWTPLFVPSNMTFPPPAKIPPQVLSTMKMNDNVAYAALPKELKGRRNMVISGKQGKNGRFRSGKKMQEVTLSRFDNEPETPTFEASEIPRLFRKVEIEYSKFGVEDFDFGFYNKTEYSGLETHILNSYTNSILQVLHYVLPIRRLSASHTTTNCPREHCLLCELGFVVRMLDGAQGTNCQASNFCKTVGVLAQAQNAIEIIDYGREPTEVDYAHMIQSFHRFLLDHLSLEGNNFPHNPHIFISDNQEQHHNPAAAPITQLLGIDAKNVIICQTCHAIRDKENMTHIVDLLYPRKPSLNKSPQASDFSGILRESLLRQMSHKATCQTCKQFSTFASRRSLATKDLPLVLAVNASAYNEENLSFWLDDKGTFLKPTIEIQGQVEGVDDPEIAVYKLRALIVQITTKEKRSHLVAIIRVPDAEDRLDLDSPWFVFNDFVVRNVSEEDALSFSGSWKVPAIVYLERIDDNRQVVDISRLPNEIDLSILSRDTSISVNRNKSLIKHKCLRFEELPRPGTLVAIDAEFVQMQQEETEFRSDGTKKVLRPARLSLARVSALRGDGAMQGVPFIDDHIHTSETIVDYLTEFSGINYGDLDPHLSRYTLTPLKLVYKKLRLLVDRGCIFIGHGLSKDFRIINIYVPPDQVIDTVDLYFLKARQRRLSLKFLSWFVLHENIQTDTHDSIEDARSTLLLYKKYIDFEEEGSFDKTLDDIYKAGRQYNWKPPPAEGADVSPTITPRTSTDIQGFVPPAYTGEGSPQQAVPFVQNAYPSSHTASPIPAFFASSVSSYLPNWRSRR